MSEFRLHRVPDAGHPPLDREELQDLGNRLVSAARVAAIDAVRASMHSEFLRRGQTLTRSDVLGWRGHARAALAAWREVDRITSELLSEIDHAIDGDGR